MQLPLNVSPVAASVIGIERQGIHLVLSLACLALVGATLALVILACSSASTRLRQSRGTVGKIEVILFFSCECAVASHFVRCLHNMPYFLWFVNSFPNEFFHIREFGWRLVKGGDGSWLPDQFFGPVSTTIGATNGTSSKR